MSRAFAVAVTGLALSLGGCGGSDDEGNEAGGASPEADRLCVEYRKAVTDVRFNASPKDQAEDFRAVAEAARAARKGTAEGDLKGSASDYLKTLDALVPAYEAAAAASAEDNPDALNRALDTAEPADEALDTHADRGGLEDCSLDEPRAGVESRVSQSGFPALIVPKGQRVPPSPDDRSHAYPLSADEAITLERGPQIPAGTVSPDRAARAFEDSNPDFTTLEPIGPLGDDQVPMEGYRYEDEGDRGTLGVFSGQGHLWLIVCRSRRPGGPSPDLEAACKRAADTAGFLMF